MNPAPRGHETFRSVAEHGENEPVVELTVDYAVSDAAAFVLSVSRWHGVHRLETLWQKSS
jgi:hypothetical protein